MEYLEPGIPRFAAIFKKLMMDWQILLRLKSVNLNLIPKLTKKSAQIFNF